QTCGRIPASAEPRKGHAPFDNSLSGVYRTVFYSQCVSNLEIPNPDTLSPHTQKSFITCFWGISPLRNQYSRYSIVRAQENGERTRLGYRRTFPKPDVKNLCDSKEVGIFLRRQPCKRSGTAGIQTSERKTHTHNGADFCIAGHVARAISLDGTA